MWNKLTVGICLSLVSSGNALAFLDFLKSPATLILNQKDCTFMGQNKGEVVNGKFILGGAGVIFMTLEQVDANRVSAKMQNNDAAMFVLEVKKGKGTISAIRNVMGTSVTFLECSL